MLLHLKFPLFYILIYKWKRNKKDSITIHFINFNLYYRFIFTHFDVLFWWAIDLIGLWQWIHRFIQYIINVDAALTFYSMNNSLFNFYISKEKIKLVLKIILLSIIVLVSLLSTLLFKDFIYASMSVAITNGIIFLLLIFNTILKHPPNFKFNNFLKWARSQYWFVYTVILIQITG